MPHDRFGRTLAEVERDHIIATVQDCEGNRTRAAKVLHISIRSLRMKMQDYLRRGFDTRSSLDGSDAHCQWGDPIH
jgi:DNA-binding NtrC family response regulator